MLSWKQFRDIYRNATGLDAFTVESAKPHVPEDLLPELTAALHDLLRKYIANDCFGNGLAHVVGIGGAPELTVSDFALDIIRTAAILGSDRAAQLLHSRVEAQAIPCSRYVILSGVSIEQSLEIDGGIRFESLPDSLAELSAHLPYGRTWQVGTFGMMGAVKMKIDFEAKPVFYRPGKDAPDIQQSWAYGPFAYNSVDALCETLSLACNVHVSSMLQWSDCGEDVRALGLIKGPSYPSGQGNGYSCLRVPLSQQHLEETRNLLVNRLSGKERSNLDLAIRRWMRSKSRTNYPDQFIELRIALETLYLKGVDRGELGFRLSNYGAWHLGTGFEERQKYQKILNKAYGRGSRAVHTGEVKCSEEIRDLLYAAQDLCRKGILKRLEEGEEPNWNELILGNET